MICLECGGEYKNIAYPHLKYCCGMTADEYKKKHNVQNLADEDVKKKFGQPGEKNPNWQGGKTTKNCEICNKRLSKHSFVTRCNKCLWIGKENPFLGKKHSDDTRKRMSESAKKRDRSEEVRPPMSEDRKELQRKIAKNYWKDMSKEDKMKKLESFIKAGIKASRKSSETRIENMICDILKSFNVVFSRNKYVCGKVVDFLVDGNRIIECYGDYWHCNPTVYKEDYYNKSLHMTSKEKWIRDEEKIKILNKNGFDVKVFWENDIKNNLEIIKCDLKKFLKLRKAKSYE